MPNQGRLEVTPCLAVTVDRWWPFTGRAVGQKANSLQGKRRWDIIRLGGDFHCSKFWAANLAPSQYNVLRILCEWWDDLIQPKKLGQVARKVIELVAEKASLQELQLRTHRRPAQLSRSKYHKQMYYLFYWEFLPELTPFYPHMLEMPPVELERQREWAVSLAAFQRVTSGFLEGLREASVPGDGAGVPSPRHGLRLPEILSTNLSATLSSCTWLHTRNTRSERPVYLWDVSSCRTIEATKAISHDYICISHMWGRFAIDGQSAEVEGTPWRVPRNSIFDIEDLPSQLLKAFGRSYVWIELLCIPQNRSAVALREIARQAIIFRNAAAVVAWISDGPDWDILRSTTKYIKAWYLEQCIDVPYCYNVRACWMLLHQARTDLASSNDQEPIFCSPTRTPHPWLTSLWTLQELYLRPDMMLCNQHWEPLLAGESTVVSLDTLIAFSGTRARGDFQNPADVTDWGNERAWYLDPSLPFSLQDAIMYSFMRSVEEATLWQLSDTPAPAIGIGQARQVSEKGSIRRAEAIISPIGATDWHKEYRMAGPGSLDSNMVFELYPLPFLREIATKYPFSFFGSFDVDLTYLNLPNMVGQSSGHMQSEPQAVGFMMPFKSSTKVLQQMVAKNARFYDARSLATNLGWHIRSDGSVQMEKVIGIRFNNPALRTPWEISLEYMVAPDRSSAKTDMFQYTYEPDKRRASIGPWLSSFYPSSRNHAICLSTVDSSSFKYDHMTRFGTQSSNANGPNVIKHCAILLNEVGIWNGTTILIKVGVFLVPESLYTDLEEGKVNWRVL